MAILLQLTIMDVGNQLILTVLACSFILAIGMGYIIFLLIKRPNELKEDIEKLKNDLKATLDENKNFKIEISNKDKEIGELNSKIETTNSENNDIKGQIKQLESTFNSLKSDHKIVQNERDTLKEAVIKSKNEEEQRKIEHDDKLNKLESARVALEKETERTRNEAEEKQRKEIEALGHVWKEHEDKVIAKLAELCQRQDISFMFHDNKNLPSDWDGKLKPDFMLQFLGQYLIFDAKLSQNPEGLQNYISNQQVDSTYNKVKNNSKIYPTLYLVVPSEAIGFINQFHYYVHGYNFFIITTEALEPLLLNLKEITKYDLADSFDPQDRESIINAISELDYHINLRNAADLTLTQWGVETLERVKNFNTDLSKDVTLKKEKMDIKAINKSHLKGYMASIKAQQEEINRLSTPVAPVQEKDIKEAKTLLIEDN